MMVSKFTKNLLAVKLSLALVYGVGTLALIKPEPVHAGIPVIDVAGLTQHIISAIQNVQEVLQTIQSYQTQIQQFQQQIINSIQPAVFLWDDANNIVNGLLNQIDTVTDLSAQFGTIENYLDRFQDLDTYRNAPCLANGCNRNQMTNWLANQRNLKSDKSTELSTANRAIVKGIEDQQAKIMADAQALRRLQNSAVGTQGQVQVMQAANQLASTQVNQLLQIRGLLVSQQNAIAAAQLVESDKEALEQAASIQARSNRGVQPSAQVQW